MTPIALTKRLVKGSALTAEEHDNNLQGLKTACEELNIEKYGKSNLTYNAEHYAISGAINKVNRNFTFQETTANSVIVGAEMKYFKSLDKVLNVASSAIKFPQAPTVVALPINLIANGTFDTDTSGWYQYGGGDATLTAVNGKAKLSFGTVGGMFRFDFPTVVGVKYSVKAYHEQATSPALQININGSGNIDLSGVTNYTTSFVATSTTSFLFFRIYAAGYSYFDNVEVFPETPISQFLCYDNILLKDDGTYIITRTEQNQYLTQDTTLNYTSKLYNVSDGSDTGTTITMTNDVTVEEYIGSDGHKYSTIGADKRFNQGLYHEVFNEFGTKKASDDKYWYDTAQSFLSIADCFNPSKLLTTSGNYASGKSGRPDGKYYDIIYGESFIDQRWDAAWKIGSKELTTKERDLDISAGKFADFVGSATYKTEQFLQSTTGTVNTLEVRNGSDYTIGDVVQVYDMTASTVKGRFYITGITGNTLTVHTTMAKSANQYLIGGGKSRLRYGSSTFLHTDIIGNPANYPAVWKDALASGGSISGTPLLIGENGESLLPNGSDVTFKATKKVINVNLVVYTPDSGATYGVDTSTWKTALESQANALTVAQGGNMVFLLQYQAYNNNLSPIVNSRVVGGSAGLSRCFAGNYYQGNRAASFCNKLIFKTPVNPTAPVFSNQKELTPYVSDDTIKLYSDAENINTHDTISLYGSTSPAVKLTSYLTNETTRHKQCYVFKEMKYDATGVNQDGTPTNTWGDDNKFNIVDNMSTITDNNGNTCLIGQKARLVDYRVKE